MVSISVWVYAGEYVCAGEPNSSAAKRASQSELAVVAEIYSRKMGNVRHKANDFNARINSASAHFATSLISERLARNFDSSII